MDNNQRYTGFEIAIVGMACRFPGAANWREYWDNLEKGIESIRTLSDEELSRAGVENAILFDKDLVKAGVDLPRKEFFDSSFFNYRPDDAVLLNPSHRAFHECAWEALEDAGYDPDRMNGHIGVYAGAGDDLNWKIYSILKNANRQTDDFTLTQINNKDNLASLLSYKLNLKGPSLSINTACSTSLVAIHLACKSLLLGESKIALAGGVTILAQKSRGYIYREGMILSPDGHCRAFDKNAGGTVAGEGVGIVVLKRLNNAIADGDHIYAAIKGSAINNDGNRKVGYTAPSVEGQLECIKMAHKLSKVDPVGIDYIEAHGTGTKLGDPVEIEALNLAFQNERTKHTVIGSVKTNIGHLDTAAGVAGLIKAALCLKFKRIPATLHFKEFNPEADFDGGPFYINNGLKEWERKGDSPLRAGVSSFGIGGTNAHVVLEEAPDGEESGPERPYKIMVVSAKTEKSLHRYLCDLRAYLYASPEVGLADMSYMLQTGRKHFDYRKYAVFENREELLSLLDYEINQGKATKSKLRDQLIFMFPGQGAQFVNMGIGLYEKEKLFREWMDRGFIFLQNLTGIDFRDVLYPGDDGQGKMHETRYTQPLVFLFEYSIARLIMSLGIMPEYMIGHSIGEYVAAAISGVFSFEDALRLVVRRGELISSLSSGVMVSAAMASGEAGGYAVPGVSIAAVNSPGQVVFSGNIEPIARLMHTLDASGISYIKLHTSHAFHSEMLDVILEDFRGVLERTCYGKVKIPFVSNLTGDLIKEQEAISPDYWVRHMRETVKFSAGIQTLVSLCSDPVFIETGPGHSLTSMVKQHRWEQPKATIDLVRRPGGRMPDLRTFSEAIGRLWSLGVNIDWVEYNKSESRKKISLPTYSFENTRYPVEVDPAEAVISFDKGMTGLWKGRELKDWIYYPVWKNVILLPTETTPAGRGYLFFTYDTRFTGSIKPFLINTGDNFIEVIVGASFERESECRYTVNPCSMADYEILARSILQDQLIITDIIYCWTIGIDSTPLGSKDPVFETHLTYFGLANIVKAFLHTGQLSGKRITLLTDRLYRVIGSENPGFAASLLLGLMNSLPQEYSVKCFNVDVDLSGPNSELPEKIALEIRGNRNDRILAIRNGIRWVRDYQQNSLPLVGKKGVLRTGGVYMITGGSGNVGSVLTRYLVEKYHAKVAVIGRREYSHLDKIPGVFYYKADVANLEEFRARVEEIVTTLGPITGIIHAAGLTDHRYFELVEDITVERALAIFSPKVHGIKNIYEIFKDKRLDFVWATSSLSSLLGGIAYSSYSSANLYMDHFIAAVSTGLSNWKSVQLSEMIFDEESIQREKNDSRLGLKPPEICELFEWSLGIKEYCVISETVENLFLRIKRVYEEKRERYLDTDFSPDDVEKIDRPDLITAYVAPETETEIKVVEMLENFFGVRGIGVEDNFFELGGDSLKATVFLRRLEQTFLIKMPMADFFLADHVRKIADEIDEKLWLHKKSENHVVSVI
jgi:acyl transferase domain-containing protein/acyl carrier protein